jgi:hypothetical protein
MSMNSPKLLRTAASQDGLELASLNWIFASLMNHGFVAISPSNDRRSAATEAGYFGIEMRPALPKAVQADTKINSDRLRRKLSRPELPPGLLWRHRLGL